MRIEVALEVYVGDLKTFERMSPDDWLKDMKAERPPLDDRLARFSDQGLGNFCQSIYLLACLFARLRRYDGSSIARDALAAAP